MIPRRKHNIPEKDSLFIAANTIDEAWEKAFGDLYYRYKENKKIQDSRDGSVASEILNAYIQVYDPTRNLVKSPIRKLPTRYAIGELLWYLSGNKNISAIRNFTKAWDRMSDDGETVNSNYGYCIKHKFGFDQWDYVRELLQQHPESRQAVIHIKEARDTLRNPTKDLNCTCTLQFFIRDNRLYLTVYMRSNDVWMGLPYDMFSFTCLQMLMAMELNVEIGSYTHIAGSLHLYDRDRITAEENMRALEENEEKKNTTECQENLDKDTQQ